MAADVLGRLSRVVGKTSFINSLIQSLVELVVVNRDPDSRAGASLALGCIHGYVGGMAAGSHLKTIVGILHSLAADPHPLVHKWALFALWLTIDSAGLLYEPFINSTLSIVAKVSLYFLFQLFMAESHEITASLSNLPYSGESNSEASPCLGRILYSILGVIGPDLGSSSRVRDLCFRCSPLLLLLFSLYEELKNDDDPFVMVEALKCIQHFILFAPSHLNIEQLVPFLSLQLSNTVGHSYLKHKSAVTCIYQLVQRDADQVRQASESHRLEETLFSLLDFETDSSVQLEIKDILLGLMRCTVPLTPSRYLFSLMI